MARRTHLRDVVASLARQIADGDLPIVDDMAADAGNVIDLKELRHLAQLCEARHLPAEAARIRRWLETAQPLSDPAGATPPVIGTVASAPPKRK